ncbi:MAG: hypothetical protein D6830_07625 [Ignavibacteria bacterium]|nr:MAG: hypothetical protein D6830_07625 [Ignavibacteria bacterium]
MKENVNKIYYALPALLAVLMFSSNFLSTDLFSRNVINFAVWFILSIFAFSLGWIITNTLDWDFGGRVVFAVIIVTAVITMFFITIFQEYFNINSVLTENILLYILRNIYIGLMGVFGMAVSKLIELQRITNSYETVNATKDEIIENAKEKANLIIAQAKVDAAKITLDAENKIKNLEETQVKMETKLNEFIKLEKELLNRYKNE